MMRAVLGPLVGAALGLVVGALIIAASGADPLAAYASLAQGALGGARPLTETVLKATLPANQTSAGQPGRIGRSAGGSSSGSIVANSSSSPDSPRPTCQTAEAQFSELKYQLKPQIEFTAIRSAVRGKPYLNRRHTA